MNDIAAILLAAGQSRRMGSCKQLLPLGETTVIGRCITTLRAAGIDRIVVVVASDGDAVAEEAGRFPPVLIVRNPTTEGDMASSVRVGRESPATEACGVVVALCDCPLVQPATVRLLLDAGRAHPGRIIIPLHAGRRGHPLLIPRPILNELTECLTLRDIVRCDPARVVELPVADPGVLQDMDTPEDFRRICSYLELPPG